MLSVHALLLPTPLSFEMFSHMRSDREPCVNLVSECTIQVHVLVIAHISLPVVYDARLRGSAACNSLSRDRISVCRVILDNHRASELYSYNVPQAPDDIIDLFLHSSSMASVPLYGFPGRRT